MKIAVTNMMVRMVLVDFVQNYVNNNIILNQKKTGIIAVNFAEKNLENQLV